MHRIIVILTMILTTSLFMKGEESSAHRDTIIKISPWSFGGFAGLGYAMHKGEFSGLQGIPNCCPQFSNATGIGPAIDIAMHYTINPVFGAGLRFGINGIGGNFTHDQKQVVMSPQNEITITHTINTSISLLAFEPEWTFFYEKFLLGIGPVFGLPVSSNVDQKETVSQGTFNNGSRIRNEFTGDIPGMPALIFGAGASLKYQLPMNVLGNMRLVPELRVLKTFNEFSASTSWTALQFRAGIGVMWSPVNIEYPPQEIIIPEPTKPVPLLTSLQVFKYATQSNDSLIPLDTILVQESIVNEVQPLLPYVFFDDNADTIPMRYRKLTREESEIFSEQSMMSMEVLDRYLHILNIAGKRLQENPELTVTLTGCINVISERKNTQLGKRRAESIATYLRTIWKIDSSRVKIVGRELPENPSNSQYIEGQEENRRVEITFSDPSAFEILRVTDTQRIVKPNTVIMQGKVISGGSVTQWRMSVIEDTALLLQESLGKDDIGVLVPWKLQVSTLPTNNDTITFRYNVVDSIGRSSTQYVSVPLMFKTVMKDKTGKLVEGDSKRYSLILFEFDKAQLQERNLRILDEVKKDMQGKSVSILGATDIHGNPNRNTQLALQRAKAVARELGVDEQSVKGDSAYEEYTNALPEGRFYNRTVIVNVQP